MKKFKDACDKCGKFDYCVGQEGKVLCPQCLAPIQEAVEEDGEQHPTTSDIIRLFTQPVCD